MSDLLVDVAKLSALEPNWDSYGAPAIDRRCIQRAQEIAAVLRGRWVSVPMSNGGVALELHDEGFDIEITVERSGAGQ